jgi:hypothetical protein
MRAYQSTWPCGFVTVLPADPEARALCPSEHWLPWKHAEDARYQQLIVDLISKDESVVVLILIERTPEQTAEPSTNAPLEPLLGIALSLPLRQPTQSVTPSLTSLKTEHESRRAVNEHLSRLTPLETGALDPAPGSSPQNVLHVQGTAHEGLLECHVCYSQTKAYARLQRDVLVWRVTDSPDNERFPEVRIHLRAAGRWYGTGHLMQQHWPSCAACLELGPFYPFDNGVCGLGTLAIPGWCTTGGFAILVDERRTPYLHVGMNAPRETDAAASHRAWTVGHENALRQVLPLRDRRFPPRALAGSHQSPLPLGDDLLRIQSRYGYDYERVWHPLLGTRLGYEDELVVYVHLVVTPRPNVRAAREALLERMGAAATGRRLLSPPRSLLQHPIWTTWARFKQNVTQEDVLSFAQEIVARNLPRSVMEIDDRWSEAYGDFRFDRVKFPQPAQMVQALHALGFKVTLWCTAFIEEKSQAYLEGRPKGYLVADGALFPWWQPQPVAALDVANPEACRWFLERARMLRAETGVDGFKFDSGEPCWLPRQLEAYTQLAYPGQYTDWWLQRVVLPLILGTEAPQVTGTDHRIGMEASASLPVTRMDAGSVAASDAFRATRETPYLIRKAATREAQPATESPRFSVEAEARTNSGVAAHAVLSATTLDDAEQVPVAPAEARAATATGLAAGAQPAQWIPCLYRMFDRFSHDGIDNGLASVIPTMLTSGVLGFSFVLPDMVGGNEYDQVQAGADLMMRWLYANALMPSIQLSLPPWKYGASVEAALVEALAVRKHILEDSGLLEALVRSACEEGAPLARPMWWLCPQLAISWDIDDQFMLGDDVLVAPMLTPLSAVYTSAAIDALNADQDTHVPGVTHPLGPTPSTTATHTLERVPQQVPPSKSPRSSSCTPNVTDSRSLQPRQRQVWLPPGNWCAYHPSSSIGAVRLATPAPAPLTGPCTITTTSVLPVYVRVGSAVARFVFADAEEAAAHLVESHGINDA